MASTNFTTQDLLQHPSFRKWVLQHDETATAFWSEWLRTHPDQKGVVKEAAEILLAIDTQYKVPPNALADTWNRVWRTIGEAERTGRKPALVVEMKERVKPLRRWFTYAAMVAGVMIAIASAWQFFYINRKLEYRTAMGELKTIELPDHSIVRLNVNSSVRYTAHWGTSRPREIWVNGEAFFTVTHQKNNQAFIVHTNDVDIRVVGTEFNVNTRRVKTEVVLKKGVVQLEFNAGDSKGVTKPIIMKPGDMITYSATTAELSNKKVDPEDYSSWQNRVLTFSDAPIEEVIRAIQENTDVKIESTDTSLNAQTFTGSIPLNNLDVFFKTLSRSFDVKIEQTNANAYKISSN